MKRVSWLSPSFALLFCGAALLACKQSGSDGNPEAVASATPEPQGTVFAKKIPSLGEKRVEDSKNEINVDIEVKRAGNVIHRSAFKKIEHERKRIEVLAANETAVTKVRVTYLEKYESEAQGNATPKKKKSPVSDKTYEVEAVGGSRLVKDESGKTPSAKEVQVVSDDMKSLGRPEEMAAFIPDRPLTDGEKLPVSADLVRRMFSSKDDDEMKIDQATFTFRGTQADGSKTLGTFDVALKLAGVADDQDLGMIMDLSGKLTIDTASSWPRELSLKGPLTMKGKSDKAGAELEGKGSMTMSISVQYE